MGRRSRRTVTPSTRGILPLAKAPRLWKYGVQRSSAHKVPSERVSGPREVFSWMPAQWHETRVKSCGCRRNGNRCFMVAPWRLTTGVEPDAVKAARPVLNGGCDMKSSQSLLCATFGPDTTRCPISGILRRCAGR